VRHVLAGGCHCGNLRLRYTTGQVPEETVPREDGCGFCRRHGVLSTSDPAGEVVFDVADPAALVRYRFAHRTADYLICAQCGVYVAAEVSVGDDAWAVLNIRALDDAARFILPSRVVDWDHEDAAARIKRRIANWTPVRPA
jgi:hypothetical protein